MFFFLSKIFAFLLMPLTWFFILLIIAWRVKDPGRKKRFRVAALVVLLVFSNRFIFDRTMHAWEINAVKEPAAGSYDEIIVQCGMSLNDQQLDRDRYDCHVWAVKQSGFDPSQPGVPAGQRVVVEPATPPGANTAVGAIAGAISVVASVVLFARERQRSSAASTAELPPPITTTRWSNASCPSR